MSSEAILEEIKTILLDIGTKLDYQSKLFEEAFMSQQEKQSVKMSTMLAPLQMIQGIMSRSAEMADNPEAKKMCQDMSEALKAMGDIK